MQASTWEFLAKTILIDALTIWRRLDDNQIFSGKGQKALMFSSQRIPLLWLYSCHDMGAFTNIYKGRI